MVRPSPQTCAGAGTAAPPPSVDGGNALCGHIRHMTNEHEQITPPIIMPYLPTLTGTVTVHL